MTCRVSKVNTRKMRAVIFSSRCIVLQMVISNNCAAFTVFLRRLVQSLVGGVIAGRGGEWRACSLVLSKKELNSRRPILTYWAIHKTQVQHCSGQRLWLSNLKEIVTQGYNKCDGSRLLFCGLM